MHINNPTSPIPGIEPRHQLALLHSPTLNLPRHIRQLKKLVSDSVALDEGQDWHSSRILGETMGTGLRETDNLVRIMIGCRSFLNRHYNVHTLARQMTCYTIGASEMMDTYMYSLFNSSFSHTHTHTERRYTTRGCSNYKTMHINNSTLLCT